MKTFLKEKIWNDISNDTHHVSMNSSAEWPIPRHSLVKLLDAKKKKKKVPLDI